MRAAFPIAAVLTLAGGGATAAPAPEMSWGKPGVAFEAYRADATQCLRIAHQTDLRGTRPAEILAAASRRIEAALPAGSAGGADADALASESAVAAGRIARIVEATRADDQIAAARLMLQTAMDECLLSLGYRRFRLTDGQRDRLRRLGVRREARQVYLHSLASDPAILAAQAL